MTDPFENWEHRVHHSAKSSYSELTFAGRRSNRRSIASKVTVMSYHLWGVKSEINQSKSEHPTVWSAWNNERSQTCILTPGFKCVRNDSIISYLRGTCDMTLRTGRCQNSIPISSFKFVRNDRLINCLCQRLDMLLLPHVLSNCVRSWRLTDQRKVFISSRVEEIRVDRNGLTKPAPKYHQNSRSPWDVGILGCA
jgi:hypothetical protein